jgi:5-methylcytosine-specific restriction enzyme subunit McrC
VFLELDELDRDGVVVDLEDAQAEALATSRLLDVRAERHGWRLTPRGLVGSARVDDLQVDVRPKQRVGLGRVLFLLGYARDPCFEPGLVEAAADDDLWPALAESLLRLARTALAQGVLQGYRTMDEALRTVRGRIRIGDQLARRPGQLLPIEVTYDEFTVDIVENQLLRTALRRMLAVPRLSDRARSALGHLDGRLAGVAVLTPGTPLPHWHESRVNARYAPALRLAELVLANLSAETGPGQLAMASFAVDMAVVFEQFVETALREALAGYPGRTAGQYRTRLDRPDGPGAVGIPMLVDVVHLVHDRPCLVFDAKYKAAGSTGAYPNADHYQMLAYCTALDVPTAWLVYADAGAPRIRRVVNTDVSIVEHPIDLSQPPAALLGSVDVLVRQAWGHAGHPVAAWRQGTECHRSSVYRSS